MPEEKRKKSKNNAEESKMVTPIAVSLSLLSIVYVADLFRYVGFDLIQLPYCSLFLALLLSLVFLKCPFKKGSVREKVPFYDVLLIILAISGPLYNLFFWEGQLLRMNFQEYYFFEYVFAFSTIILTLEATRRVLGLAMPLIAGFFIFHAMFSSYFPGFLHVGSPTIERVISTLIYNTQGVYGVALNTAAVVVIIFIIFGQFLLTTGAGDFFTNLAMALFGHVRGGPAKMAIGSSAAFGTLSGATTANVATTGAFSIPMMKKIGYNSEFAGAVETVASNGGQVMPPVMGVVAFIMAEWLGVSYLTVCLAALIPAFLYYLAEFIMVDIEAVKLNLKGLPRAECPPFWSTLKSGWFNIIPVLVIVLLIGLLRYSPQYSGLFALALLIVLYSIDYFIKYTRKGSGSDSLSLKRALKFLISGLRGGALNTLPAGVACATAGLIIGSLDLSQLGLKLSHTIVLLAGDSQFLLLVMAAICCFVLGVGMTSIPAYMMVVILVAPALQKFGISPLAAHFFVFYWAITSFITPPVALGAYVAAGIADASPLKTGIISMRLGIITYLVPFIFVYNPELLLIGKSLDIVMATITSIGGVVFLSYGISNLNFIKMVSPKNKIVPIVLVSGGILLMNPGLYSDLIGAGLGLIGMYLLKDIGGNKIKEESKRSLEFK
jgi:TRAP transporter 4TM/12TM fusion protein